MTEGGMNRENTDRQGNETILFDTIMMDICRYVLMQNHRMYNTKSEP